MGAGTLALAGLLWAAAAPPTAPDWIAMKERAIQIPININPQRKNEIRDLLLFVSTDQGVTWNQEGKATPDKQFFPFYAQNDGMYWFAVCIVDVNGRRDPPDLRQLPPGLKVLIDTQPPIVKLPTADRSGDDVTVTWTVQEINPDISTFRLEYRPLRDGNAGWTPITVSPAPQGQHTFRVNFQGAVSVRLTMQDGAANVGQAMKVAGDDTGVTSTVGYPPSAAPGAASPIMPVAVPPSAGGSPTGIVPLQPSDPPPLNPGPSRADMPAIDKPAAPAPAMTPIGTSPNPRETFTATPRDANSRTGSGSNTNAGPAAAPPRPEMRNIQLVNSKQVTFNYGVSRQGPSGIRRALLYVTDNDGQTWQQVGEDVYGNQKVTANLAGEGIYGFRLVLESGAGLSKGAPVNGADQPQMRVEVDVTPPEVNIYEPAPDPNSNDTLILRWSATDKNLANNRIKLEYSATENGPWTQIAEVPNTGQYPWKLASNMPVRVYLRVTAKDLAGNEGIAKTSTPQLIDLNRPEGELKDIAKTTIQLKP